MCFEFGGLVRGAFVGRFIDDHEDVGRDGQSPLDARTPRGGESKPTEGVVSGGEGMVQRDRQLARRGVGGGLADEKNTPVRSLNLRRYRPTTFGEIGLFDGGRDRKLGLRMVGDRTGDVDAQHARRREVLVGGGGLGEVLRPHGLAPLVQQTDADAVEASIGATVGATPKNDPLNRLGAEQIHFPPRIGFLFGVRDRFSLEVVTVRVAVDGQSSRAVVIGAGLRGLALSGDVFSL